jgi:3-oxoadipate enol-lactonase
MPFADLSGARLHYELRGAPSSEVLVLAHSLGANLHMWDKIVPALEQHYRVLRYDTRGHGSSSVPASACTITQLAGDVVELLNHLQIERAHFCGLSLGGVVGMSLGIHESQRIGRLILANTAARIGTREGWEERIAAVRASGLQELATAALERWFTAEFHKAAPQEMETIRSMIANTSVQGYIACCEALRDADLRPEVASIQARTLIITGSEDPATPPADGLWLHQAVQGSACVELPTAHLSAWERPEEFQHAVIDFLR